MLVTKRLCVIIYDTDQLESMNNTSNPTVSRAKGLVVELVQSCGVVRLRKSVL